MTCYQEKIKRHTERYTQFEGIEQASEQHTQGRWEFKISIINILRALIDKVNSLQE